MNDSNFIRRRACARGSVLGSCLLLAMPHLARAQGAPDPTPSPPAAADANKASTPANADADAEPAAADDDAVQAEADAELDAEAKASAAKLQKPPPKGKGVIWGTVSDTKFNEAVVEAQVQVQGRKEKSYADLEGRFRLELAPGSYKLRVTYELHRPSVVEVSVKAGELTRVDFQLVPDEGAVEEVVIEEEADHSSAEGQTLERKRSSAVGDGVGRAEIAHTPDRNAAEAAQRVVGATIVDGKFVYVRGLGERYTNALLNGTPLPSTEPDRNTVPLDLFPSLVLESLTINKQFLPDMPADFAGGSVRINTRDFPRQPLFQLSLSGAYNTEATGRKRPGYVGSSTDWLGFDGGRRSLPSGLPFRRLDGTPEERVAYGHRLNTPMITFLKSTPPNFGVTLVAGNSYKVGQGVKLGAIMALSYGRAYQLTELAQRIYRSDALPDGTKALIVDSEFSGQRAIDSVRWGAFGTASLEISRRHTVGLVALHSQSADDTTWDLESPGALGLHATRLEYVSRSLNFLQLRGEHHFPTLSDLELDWHGSLATAGRDQPDTRDVRYQRAHDLSGIPGYTFVSDLSGKHEFLKQSDTTVSGGLDLTQPVIRVEAHETKLKFGTLITSRRRDFLARRFQFIPATQPGFLYNQLSFCPGETWSGGCPNYLFRPELIRPDGLLLSDQTLNFDQYITGLDVYAAYGMVEAKLLPKLRVVAGVRVEITYQSFSGFYPYGRTNPQRSQLFDTDWLPAGSLVYEVTPKSNARFGASQTLARPQLRELSPAQSTSAAGDLSVQGNADLKLTKITNLDLRYEYFPSLREVLAVSLFYKHFRDPIEETLLAPSLLSFQNVPSANLVGAELEARKSLALLAAPLRDLSLLANFTLVYSRVEFGKLQGHSTTDKRPLAYQSPYVVNLALDYSNQQQAVDVRLLYNVFGPRITVVGAYTLPDTYEIPRHSLDLSAAKKFAQHLELKLQVSNILNAPTVFAYRDRQGYRQSDATHFESLGRQPETKHFNSGTTIAATATYSY